MKVENDYDNLKQINSGLKQENAKLGDMVEDTIGLYDITKNVCNTLDAAKVCGLFKEEAAKYIGIKDCQFLKSVADLDLYKEYAVFPLKMDSLDAGYLVVNGVADKDKDRFNILLQQLLLGIRRAFLYSQVQELAITDSLTQVYSRRYCLERFHEEIERSRKYNYNLSCLMVDIDYFKDCNDRYGHLLGDAVLREVAGAIKENIRQVDLMCRYGGEEFLIILAETEKAGALFVAERIRKDIEHREIIAYDEALKVTISIGISAYPVHALDMQKLINNADESLYQAKRAGRNMVCVYSCPKR